MCSKTKINAPIMYEVLDQDTMNSKILPHLSVVKLGYVSKGYQKGSHSMHTLLVENRLSMADYFCVSMMLSPLVVSSMPCNRSPWRRKRTCFPCRCPCACMRHHRFCLFFSKKFNIMSALFVHQSLTLPQKIDSREGCF